MFGNQRSTDIRDKVYALHGLSRDSATIRVDYNISPKALLGELIYYACTFSAAAPESPRSKADALCLAREMTKILKVHCYEDGLIFHISVAQGEGIELYINLKLAVRAQPQIGIWKIKNEDRENVEREGASYRVDLLYAKEQAVSPTLQRTIWH
jgi:hypothetical protein